jgi:hypothetical protein
MQQRAVSILALLLGLAALTGSVATQMLGFGGAMRSGADDLMAGLSILLIAYGSIAFLEGADWREIVELALGIAVAATLWTLMT